MSAYWLSQSYYISEMLLTCKTNFWSIYLLAAFGWKSGDSKNLWGNKITCFMYAQKRSIQNFIHPNPRMFT
jgi:hypothetical protein